MSPDTINMGLNLVAIVVWVVTAIWIQGSRKEIRDSKAAVNGLPKAIAPTQAPILAAINDLMGEAERLTVLLRDDADRQQTYKNVVAENVELRRLNGTLEHQKGVKEGENVMLNDMIIRQTGVVNSQAAQINKHLVAIQELTAVASRQQKLIEEMTRALGANTPRESQ